MIPCPIDICFEDNDDIDKDVNYDASSVDSFFMLGLDTLRENNACGCNEHNSVMYDEYEDSCVGVDSFFDELGNRDSCIDQHVEESNKSEYIFSALQVLKEPLSDDTCLHVKSIDRSCHQDEEMFHSSLQTNVVIDHIFSLQTNQKDRPDVSVYLSELRYLPSHPVNNDKEGNDLLLHNAKHFQYSDDSKAPNNGEDVDYYSFEIFKMCGNMFDQIDRRDNLIMCFTFVSITQIQ